MNLSVEQVNEMAPDASSANAGRKLKALKNWSELGRSAEALWGKCQGSAVYQVKVDLANLGYNCSCPSRKFPCKHVLGLLMLVAESPDAVSETASPDWVDEWLQKRRAREEKKSAATADAPKKPVDEKARAKRAEKREARIKHGLEQLDLWLKDLVRTGLAGLEAKPTSFWTDQSKRLVDAQAPGLASRVARLAEIPRSSRDWPERLLGELGQLKLLIHAYQRLDELRPELQHDVRQLVGFTVSQDELESAGEKVDDSWLVVGQSVDDDERVRSQRSWLVGRESRRTALVLQFAPGSQPFAESIVAGIEQQGTLLFYPGASRQRASFLKRDDAATAWKDRAPGYDTIADFQSQVADSLGQQPWLGALGAVLRDVTIIRHNGDWLVRDGSGDALPLLKKEYWKLAAITGGWPFDLAAEWDGHRLRPLGLFTAGQYWIA